MFGRIEGLLDDAVDAALADVLAIGQYIEVAGERLCGLDIATLDATRQRIADEAHADPVEVLDDQQVFGGGERFEQAGVIEGIGFGLVAHAAHGNAGRAVLEIAKGVWVRA